MLMPENSQQSSHDDLDMFRSTSNRISLENSQQLRMLLTSGSDNISELIATQSAHHYHNLRDAATTSTQQSQVLPLIIVHRNLIQDKVLLKY
ncbi:hypothetical protein BASA60_004384 [Batrachochytrium salamandrivorans]|nr:hypothetical protein BASA60_004384 [Batrachochytrium salamandrivorans]